MEMVMIENEVRYEAAIQRRIKQNARVGRSRRWLAAHADAQRLSDWLFESGEFRARCCCGNDHGFDPHLDPSFNEEICRTVRHPAAPKGEFYAKMTDSLHEWGGLTDGQTEAVRKGLQQALDRAAGRDEALNARREADLRSVHVGVVGKRGEFTAKVAFRTDYSTQFGITYITGLRDADGNILIAKGSPLMYKDAKGDESPVQQGMTIRFAAFVKAHGEREGVKQTMINRVKVQEVMGE
jgi:hypothetical protein